MKQILFLLVASIFFLKTEAQQPRIDLSTTKTTSLLFSSPIVHVDRGSTEVLVQRVKEAPHILLAKAASSGLTATNLSVVTSDGQLYSFAVQYDSAPRQWVIQVASKSGPSIEATAKSLLPEAPRLHKLRDQKGGFSLEVLGIFVHDNTFFYQVRMRNTSPIDYDVDAFRFYICDAKNAKRTAQQELPLMPLYWAVPVERIPGNTSVTTVVALEKFTVPDAKYFGMELLERSGGRHLFIKIKNRHLFKARPVLR